MADYYPLLAKAAAGLSGASPDARQAMYERARKALLGQLRTLDPPVAAEDIDRESAALDAAIARVEADLFTPIAAAEPTPDDATDNTTVLASSSVAAPDAAPSGDAQPEPIAVAAPAAPSSTAPVADGADAPDLLLRPRERPLAPTPPVPRGQYRRAWILAAVAGAVVVAVAIAALKLRDSPEDLARLKPIAAPTADTPAPSGKIVERAVRDDTPLAQSAPATNQSPRGTATTAAAPVTQAPIPVAQRAALLVEAPDLDTKVRTFLGTTVWRLDNVPSASPGQPLGTAVHGEAEIPDAKVRMTIDIRKNTDPALPAANTMEIRFALLPGSALPGISQISVPQMRREESPNGDLLAGVPVKITDTYFLVGLAQGDFEKRNADSMRDRPWIDIPIQLTDNRIAKITLEKGAPGERIMADALSTWQQ